MDTKKFQKLDWTTPASHPLFAVHLDSTNSLTIKGSPKATENSEKMVAIWTQPERETTGVNVVVVRQSKPLDGTAQALALLESFEEGDAIIESSVKWTAKARGLNDIPVD